MDAQPSEVLLPARVKVPLWLLALLMLAAAAGMHILVPALPDATNDLHVSRSTMLLAVTFYVAGMAVGQLIYGPVADYFGRRPTILGGLVLFTITSTLAIFAPSAHTLIALRFVQALGGCAGMVLGRAIVRDISGADAAAQRLALLNMMVILGPALAPIIGGFIVSVAHWRVIFMLLSAIGAFMTVLIWLILPETGARNANTSLEKLWHNYKTLITSPAFLAFAIGGGCATMAIYGFIAVAAFVFAELGRPVQETGFYLASLLAGTWLGSLIASRLLHKFHLERVMVRANLLSLFAAIVFLAAVLAGQLTVPIVVGCMFLFALGMGMASPAALAKAMSANPAVIGSASGIYGCIQMSIGALCTVAAGIALHPALGAALVLTVCGLIAQACFWFALRRA